MQVHDHVILLWRSSRLWVTVTAGVLYNQAARQKILMEQTDIDTGHSGMTGRGKESGERSTDVGTPYEIDLQDARVRLRRPR